MVGTYYTTEDGFQSTLVLNNKGPNQIVVTPILHGQSGQTFTASPVAVGGQSALEVDLNLLASIAGQQFRSGSFEFTYEGRMLEMGGGLRIVDSAKSLIFDEQMLEPGMKFPSPRLEAVYAVPFEDSQVSVIVTNTTAQPVLVSGDAIFAGANGHHPVKGHLGPYQTQVVNLPHGLVKKASAGAVSLNHNGALGALLAMIHLQDTDRGYSESVNFTNPAGKTTERHGAGLRLGSVNNDPLKPVIAVRNIGDNATTVTATIPYSMQNGDTGKIALPQVSLAPGEIKLFNTSNPQLRRNDFATAGLEIKYTGAPGSVIASATSVSQSGNHVFALPVKDPQGGVSSTGGYPWFIKESSSTVVFIKNVTDEPQKYLLSITYPGGRWGSISRTIAPAQTIAIDIRRLRDAQEKGAEGNVIPITATSGHVSWSFRGKQDKVLIGRAQTVDFSNGLASTYECQCTCGGYYTGVSRLVPDNATVFIGDQKSFEAQGYFNDCYGNPLGWCSAFPPVNFSSDNTNVASISSGTATANGVGSTNIRASWTEYPSQWICPNPEYLADCYCQPDPPLAASGVASINVECKLPDEEGTIPQGWDITGTRGVWKMRLFPDNPAVFSGRKIYEVSPPNLPDSTDTCHFPGSDYPSFKGVTTPPPGYWVVNHVNEWGPDVIGYGSNQVTYYRQRGKAPCGTQFSQGMFINCGNDRSVYSADTIGAAIGTTTVSSTRAGQTQPRNWP